MSRFAPLTPRVLDQIERDYELMVWDERNSQEHAPVKGSLGDQFWNRDVPRLIEFAREQLALQAVSS